MTGGLAGWLISPSFFFPTRIAQPLPRIIAAECHQARFVADTTRPCAPAPALEIMLRAPGQRAALVLGRIDFIAEIMAGAVAHEMDQPARAPAGSGTSRSSSAQIACTTSILRRGWQAPMA